MLLRQLFSHHTLKFKIIPKTNQPTKSGSNLLPLFLYLKRLKIPINGDFIILYACLLLRQRGYIIIEIKGDNENATVCATQYAVAHFEQTHT